MLFFFNELLVEFRCFLLVCHAYIYARQTWLTDVNVVSMRGSPQPPGRQVKNVGVFFIGLQLLGTQLHNNTGVNTQGMHKGQIVIQSAEPLSKGRTENTSENAVVSPLDMH